MTTLVLPEGVERWCSEHMAALPESVLFETGHLSRVFGLRLTDSREVVIKIRSPSPRVEGCTVVQKRLAEAGYPCPMPLVAPAPLGAHVATAETYLPGGEMLGGARIDARLFAGALATLIALAPSSSSIPSLDPAPPWVGWDHREGALWPTPDDLDTDLNALTEPSWLDSATRRVRARLARGEQEPVVGHCDWETQNLRWADGALHAVHDWDSAVSRPEAPMVGAAAAVFAADGQPNACSTAEQIEMFLDAYGDARGLALSTDERECAWAGGLWVRLFNAKKESAKGDPHGALPLLAEYIDARLGMAGA